MDDALRQTLDALHASGVAFDAEQPDRLDRRRNLEPDSAALLSVLVLACRARAVLELGTSNGYSTLWLADALASVSGARFVSVELLPERSEAARANLADAGLLGGVELVVADAGEILRESGDECWDLIFLDAERPSYAGYWPDLLRVLRPGGLLCVDNVLSHADQVAEFRALVSGAAGVREAVVPTGAGMLLVVMPGG